MLGSKISHLFTEEAENERMHLMTALEMKKPGIIFRGTILLAQGNFIFRENYYCFDESVSHRDYNKFFNLIGCRQF